MVYASLTEQIYFELMAGVEKGLDWDALLAKYGKSKGPLYNAVSRVLFDLRTKCEKLFADVRQEEERRKQISGDVARSEERKKQLDRALGDADTRLKKLEKAEAEAKEKLSRYEKELQNKEALASSLHKLEESGFSAERLQSLSKKVSEVGARHALPASESVNKFFDELKQWDEMVGLEAEVRRLSSKKNETEKKLEETEKRYQDKKVAIKALEELGRHGVGVQMVVLWNQILRSAGIEAGELQEEIEKWSGLRKFNRAEEERKKKLVEETAGTRASLEELGLRKVEVEGAIRAVMKEGVKSIGESGEKAKKEITEITRGIKQEIDGLLARVLEAGEKVGKIEKTLPSKEDVKKLLEFMSHPRHLLKTDPILFSVTSALLDWVKTNRQSLSSSITIESALETFEKELSK